MSLGFFLDMIPTTQYINGRPEVTFEAVAEEKALQIKINGRAYSVSMCSPLNKRELAVGLLYTEGILCKVVDIINITEETDELNRLSINIEIQAEALNGKNLWNRSIASNASCGVCGKTEIADISPKSSSMVTTKRLNIFDIPRMLNEMRIRQIMFDETGGTHCAALFTLDGQVLSTHEDIGRHNAVDKAIGELFLAGTLANADLLFVSGRVSFEIVSKCAMAKIPFLLAVSAPSSMAVEMCREKGITLVAFCRENRATVYTHQQNVASQKNCFEEKSTDTIEKNKKHE